MENFQEYIKNLRRDFTLKTLDEGSVDIDPFNQFDRWFKEADEASIPDFNAMVLSTVSNDKKPSSRVVLLRGIEQKGFVFFTNYNSKKGKEIELNNAGSLLFFWPQIERQIRIEGVIEKISEQSSDEYFITRPKESRIGAWASDQSSVIEGRKALEDIYLKTAESFINSDVARPPHWGGYVLKAEYFEFWQGRENRLHDRIAYNFNKKKWKISRLAP